MRSAGELFELRTRQRDVEMLGTFLIGRDERQIDVRLHDRRKFDLRFFGRLGETLHCLLVFAERSMPCSLRNSVDEPLDDAVIVVVAAEARVAVGRFHFENAVADFEDRNVERAAAEIPHEDRFVALFYRDRTRAPPPSAR